MNILAPVSFWKIFFSGMMPTPFTKSWNRPCIAVPLNFPTLLHRVLHEISNKTVVDRVPFRTICHRLNVIKIVVAEAELKHERSYKSSPPRGNTKNKLVVKD